MLKFPFAASAAESLSYKDFLHKAALRNPELGIEAAKLEAAEARSSGIRIPPPMLSAIRMKPAAGSEANGFQVDQMIPFPTKLSGDYSARGNEAKAQEKEKEGRTNEILARARLVYFSLWAGQRKLELIKEKAQIIADHIKLARSAARSDAFGNIHLLKAESDRDLLENEILAASQSLREKQAEAAAFLNEDPAAFIIRAEEPPMPPARKPVNTDEAPQIKSLRYSLESLKSRETEAVSGWLPDFSLRYKKMEASPMAPRYSEIMVGATLPFLFFWEPHSRSSEASALREEAEFRLEKERRKVEAERVSLEARAESLRSRLATLREKLLPRAEKRMKLVHNIAPRDMETLQDHRETMEAFPDLKLKELELRMELEQTSAELAKYFPVEERSRE